MCQLIYPRTPIPTNLCITPCPDKHVLMSLHLCIGANTFSVDTGIVRDAICLLSFLEHIIKMVCTGTSEDSVGGGYRCVKGGEARQWDNSHKADNKKPQTSKTNTVY